MTAPPTPGTDLVPLIRDPHVFQPSRIPWPLIAAAAFVGVLAAVGIGVTAVACGNTIAAVSASTAMPAFGVALFLALRQMERDL